MKKRIKIAAGLIAAMTLVTTMGGITASAYVYASNEQKYDLYTHAPAVAPDVVAVTKQVYLSSYRSDIKGSCNVYNYTPTTVRMIISSSLVATGYPNYRNYHSAGTTDQIQLKSNWAAINGSNYISCTCDLPNPHMDSEFICVMYAY